MKNDHYYASKPPMPEFTDWDDYKQTVEEMKQGGWEQGLQKKLSTSSSQRQTGRTSAMLDQVEDAIDDGISVLVVVHNAEMVEHLRVSAFANRERWPCLEGVAHNSKLWREMVRTADQVMNGTCRGREAQMFIDHAVQESTIGESWQRLMSEIVPIEARFKEPEPEPEPFKLGKF